MILGTEGAMLIPHGKMPLLLPEEKFREVSEPELEPRNHYHHFVDTCRGTENCESHFAQTGPMTEAIILGTVANRVPGRMLAWDSARLKITNNAEADRLLRRRYRDGWSVGPF